MVLSLLGLKIEGILRKMFGSWGVFLAEHPRKTMFFFLLLFVPFVCALAYRESYSNSIRIWAARSGYIHDVDQKLKELYGSDVSGVAFIVKVKNSANNLLTRSAYLELE